MEGHSRQDAAKAQNMDRQTLRDWVHRYNEFGGLNDRPKSGRKVFEGQLKVISDWLEKGPETDGLVRWRVQDIKNKIQTNFGVKYSMEGTRRAEAGFPSRFAASASGEAGVDLFLPNSLFLLPISPSSGVRHLIFVRGSSRHAGRSDRINDGEDILTSFNAPARPFHALVDQDLVGGRRRSAQPLALRFA